MHSGQDAHTVRVEVTRVFARVNLESTALAELERRAAAQSTEPRLQLLSRTADSLSLHVSLSAEDNYGRRIASGGSDFGMSGPRRAVWHRRHGPPRRRHRVDLHDIEDGINQMLGRDPTLHRPPRLSWGGLIKAFDEAGVSVTERDLIEAPLTVELAPDVQAELDRI